MLRFELRLVRTSVPLHLVAVAQPAIMFLLMGLVFLTPTFDLEVNPPTTAEGHALVEAMQQIGTPDMPYIRTELVSGQGPGTRQRISVETRDGVPTAVHRFAAIDANLVKNMRNRLTASALLMWDEELGGRAVRVVEHPYLTADMPFVVYVGMAMLPLTAFLSAALVGAFSTATEFERRTILEYRLSPAPWPLALAARVVRLVLTALFSVGLLLVAVGVITGRWPAPSALPTVLVVLSLVGLFGGCLGIWAGLAFRSTIPAFVVALVGSLVSWVLGGAFGLPGAFGGAYEFFSRFSPDTYAVQLLFGAYYDRVLGSSWQAAGVLVLQCLLMLAVLSVAWRSRMLERG